MAFAKELDVLAAVRAERVGHVLHQTEHRDIHHVRHVDGLSDDHADQILRRRHDDNAVKTKVLHICDGKLLDPNGVIIIKKGEAAKV